MVWPLAIARCANLAAFSQPIAGASGDHRQALFHHRLTARAVGADADDAFVGQCVDDVSRELERFDQAQRHYRHHRVELEVAGLATIRNCGVAADHVRRYLQHRLAQHRVHFSRHDRRSGLGIQKMDLADTAARPGSKPTQVVGNFYQADGERLQTTTHVHGGIPRRLGFEMIAGFAKRQAEQRRYSDGYALRRALDH
jgi:hypothetical protein